MANNRDHYRSLYTSDLLLEARENGIDPEMAIAMAERLEELMELHNWDDASGASMGGRYTFNNRSA